MTDPITKEQRERLRALGRSKPTIQGVKDFAREAVNAIEGYEAALAASEARVAALEEELRGSSRSQPILAPESANADGWIEWKGGPCPCPQSRVQWRNALGHVGEFVAGGVEGWVWNGVSRRWRIIAYRVVSDGALEASRRDAGQAPGMNPDLLNPQQEGSRDHG